MELVLKIKTPSTSAHKPWPNATSKAVLGRLKGVSLFHLPDQVDEKQNFIHRDKKKGSYRFLNPKFKADFGFNVS